MAIFFQPATPKHGLNYNERDDFNSVCKSLAHPPSPSTSIPSTLGLFLDIETRITPCGCNGSSFALQVRVPSSLGASPGSRPWPSTGLGGQEGHTLDDPRQFVLGEQEMRMEWSGTKFLLDDAVHFNSCR